MAEMKLGFRYGVGSAGALLAALCVAFTPAFAQGEGVNVPGPGKAPIQYRWRDFRTCMRCRQAGPRRACLTGMWT